MSTDEMIPVNRSFVTQIITSLSLFFIVAIMLTHSHYISRRIVGVFCPLFNICQQCATMFPHVIRVLFTHSDSSEGRPSLKTKRSFLVEFNLSAEAK